MSFGYSDLGRAYIAANTKMLRDLEDVWIWDDTGNEAALVDLRQQLEDMSDGVRVGHVHHEQWSLSWGKGDRRRSINIDTDGAKAMIDRWLAGGFEDE